MAPHSAVLLRSKSRDSRISSGTLQITKGGLVSKKKKKHSKPREAIVHDRDAHDKDIYIVEAAPRHVRERRHSRSRSPSNSESRSSGHSVQSHISYPRGRRRSRSQSFSTSSSSVSPFSPPHRHHHHAHEHQEDHDDSYHPNAPSPPTVIDHPDLDPHHAQPSSVPAVTHTRSILLSHDRPSSRSRRRRSPSPTPSALTARHDDPVVEAIRARQTSRSQGGHVFEACRIDTCAPETPGLEELASRRREDVLRHERGRNAHGAGGGKQWYEDPRSHVRTRSGSMDASVAVLDLDDRSHAHRGFDDRSTVISTDTRRSGKLHYQPVHLREQEHRVRKEHFHRNHRPHHSDEDDDNVSTMSGSTLDVYEARTVPFRPRRRGDYHDDDGASVRDDMSDLMSVVDLGSERGRDDDASSVKSGFSDASHRTGYTNSGREWKRVGNGIAEVLEERRRPVGAGSRGVGREKEREGERERERESGYVTRREYHADLKGHLKERGHRDRDRQRMDERDAEVTRTVYRVHS